MYAQVEMNGESSFCTQKVLYLQDITVSKDMCVHNMQYAERMEVNLILTLSKVFTVMQIIHKHFSLQQHWV